MKTRYFLLGCLISSGFLPAYAEIATVDYVQSVLPTQAQADWSQSDDEAADYIKNKPTIPTVNNATLTIQKNGTAVDTFTANASENKTINITVEKTDVGLGNVDNTSDANKPISTATQTALDAKQNKLDATANTGNIKGTGGVTVTTPTSGDDAGMVIINGPTLATVATSGSYNDLENKPTIPAAQVQSDWNATSGMGEILNKPSLATVATTGAYSDLSGTPTLATVATSGSYNDLSNKPSIPANAADVGAVAATQATKGGILTTNATSGDVEVSASIAASKVSGLATVATTGSYNDLENKPTIPAAQVQSDWNASSGVSAIANKPTLSTVATTGAYSDLSGTPTLATVATTGSYNDLGDKPTIPAAQVQSDWNATSGMGEILNKPSLATVATTGAYSDLSGTPSLATVATSGSYNDLSNKPSIPAAQVQADWDQTTTTAVDYIKNKPTIPTVNNATLTIQKNGTSVGTFTANASSNETINITVPTTAADVSAVPTTRTVNNKALSQDIALDGADVALTGYAKASSESAVAATDTVNEAIGKLEKALDGKQASGSYVTTTTTVNGHALSSDVSVTKSDVGLANVQNVDQTNAANITSGTIGVARLPVGTTSTTVAAGDDARFDSVPTTQPSGTAPTGRVWVWFD